MMIASGCCCGNKVGFDQVLWGQFGLFRDPCFTEDLLVENVAVNVTELLQKCAILFAGNNGVCGNSIRFNVADWPAIGDWIFGGGRMYIAAEHSGDFIAVGNPPHESGKCLRDMGALNNFLTLLGSSVRYLGGDYVDFDIELAQNLSCTRFSKGEAALGSHTVFGSRFGEITGGTSLWIYNETTYTDKLEDLKSNRPKLGKKTVAAIDKIGDGFVIVCGDSDCFTLCRSGCDFPRALYNTDNANMI